MVKFTGTEAARILLIYRRFLQTNKLVLTEEEREFMLNGIEIESFNCFNSVEGVLGYKQWALPVAIAPKHFIKNMFQRDMLSDKKRRIFVDINHQIYTNCLLAIWDGSISSKAILYASLIEAGYALDVIPEIDKRNLSSWGVNSKVTRAALLIIQERKKAEHEDLQQS